MSNKKNINKFPTKMVIAKPFVLIPFMILIGGYIVFSETISFGKTHKDFNNSANWLTQSEECIEFQADRKRHRINPLCEAELDQAFGDEPIWSFENRAIYGARGGWFAHSSVLKSPRKVLPFTTEDYYGENTPTWRQIFDKRYYARKNTVTEVIINPDCISIPHNWESDTSLATHCHARELTIFAISLDVCLTSIDFYFSLHYRDTSDLPSNFENGLNALSKYRTLVAAEEPAISPPIDEQLYINKYLLTHWILSKCDDVLNAYVGIDLDQIHAEPNDWIASIDKKNTPKNEMYLSMSDIVDIVKPQYTLAINTAARFWEPWATRSFIPPAFSEDPKFWELLSEKDPSLYHRYMSSDYIETKLIMQDRLANAFAAYELFQTQFEGLEIKDEYEEHSPTNSFSDYIQLGRIAMKSIYQSYSRKLLDSIQSIEDAKVTKPDTSFIILNERLRDFPPGSTTINVETHYP